MAEESSCVLCSTSHQSPFCTGSTLMSPDEQLLQDAPQPKLARHSKAPSSLPYFRDPNSQTAELHPWGNSSTCECLETLPSSLHFLSLRTGNCWCQTSLKAGLEAEWETEAEPVVECGTEHRWTKPFIICVSKSPLSPSEETIFWCLTGCRQCCLYKRRLCWAGTLSKRALSSSGNFFFAKLPSYCTSYFSIRS